MTFKIAVIALLLAPLLLTHRFPLMENLLERIVRLGFVFAVAMTLPLFLAQLAVVLLRSVFSVSLIWLQESTLYFFGAIFLLASGGLLLTEGHVRVDIFYTKLTERRRALIDGLGMLLFVIPMSILIIFVSWEYVATSWVQLERSQEASGIHAVFLLKSLVPAFATLLLFAAEVQLLRIGRKLKAPA